jgi:Ring finger domain
MFRGGFGGGGDDNRSYEDWLSFIDSQTGGASNRGATEEEINALPTETVHRRPRRRGSSGAGPSSSSSSPSAAAAAAGVDEADKCAICLGEFEPGTVVKRLPCTHVFCDGCISQWLAINKECPCCKASIRDGTRS